MPFLLAAIPFYNFLGLKWDQNSLLIPLWALAMWAMMRALATRHLGWAALAGLAAAAAMLTKYWSVFLLVALAFAALADRRRVAYFTLRRAVGHGGRVHRGGRAARLVAGASRTFRRSPGSRRGASPRPTFGSAAARSATMPAAPSPMRAPALLLVLVFIRPTRAAIADSWFPRDDRRAAAILFWTPLLLPFVPASIKSISPAVGVEHPGAQSAARDGARLAARVVPRVAVQRIAAVDRRCSRC